MMLADVLFYTVIPNLSFYRHIIRHQRPSFYIYGEVHSVPLTLPDYRSNLIVKRYDYSYMITRKINLAL